jgi:hypothetical protein
VSRHRRTHVPLVLIAALVLMAVAAAACSAQASGESAATAAASSAAGSVSGSGDASGSSAAASSGGASARSATDDWGRIADALAWMQAVPPTRPVVVLLGGSSARESTVSDKSWRDQIDAKGGPQTLAWNMGSHNRTMAQNLAIVKALPKDARTVVFIGINLGSFTSTQKTATIKLPSPAPSGDAISLQQPHQYTTALSTTKKRALVQQWISQRYPVYKANFAANAAILTKIIQLCQARHYTPVLLELPRNSSIIGTALDAPTAKYREKCRKLALTYHIPWMRQLVNLPNADFYDLWHLLKPGQAVWQSKLSTMTSALL